MRKTHCNMWRWRMASAAVLALLAASSASQARVLRIVVDERKAAAEGRSFGQAGAYEYIRGRIFGEVDPKDPRNAIIQDIAFAPRNARGMVEYISTFTLYSPTDLTKGNRVLLAEVPNRGNRTNPIILKADGSPDLDATILAFGYSVISVGWQGDLPEAPSANLPATALKLESALVPRAHNADGSRITGLYLIRVPTLGGEGPDGGGPTGVTMALNQGRAGPLSYFPASFDTSKATLTNGPAEDINGKPTGPKETIANTDWTWWNCTTNDAATTAKKSADLCVKLLKGTFDPRMTYTLVFTARDPLVLTLGMAATRDAVSFFRYATHDEAGAPNPLAGGIDHVIGKGDSQTGNFVKSFIGWGFNEDESGRIAWDGANAHIAGRRIPINFRFASSGSSPTLFAPGSEGILWWGSGQDTLHGGVPGSLLDRCTKSKTCPKVFETFGSSEFWNQRITPGLVGTDLKRDIPLPENVRRYYFPGTTHGGGRGGFELGNFPLPASDMRTCTLPQNQNPEKDQMRALFLALTEWVTKNASPPPSRYPELRKSEIVPAEKGQLQFPHIPGVPMPYGIANPLIEYDFGPDFDYREMSGIIRNQPPPIKRVVPALVPQVDSSGNETSGVFSVQHMAPLGTYLGWNTYRAGPYAGQICSLNGGFVPFAKTAADRRAANDPRPSLEERYGSREGYVWAVEKAVKQAVTDRFLLREDGARLIAEAKKSTESGDLAFLPSDPNNPVARKYRQ